MFKEQFLPAVNENFMKAWYLPDLSLCDDLIRFFDQSSEVRPGTVLKQDTPTIVKEVKDSLDLQMYFHDSITQRYVEVLDSITKQYTDHYVATVMGAPLRLEAVNMQKYMPGGAFHRWHTERLSDDYPNRARVLVFMTYLNDITDGGETEWMYQQCKVQPRKGLTVIWPADWTHAHRGLPSLTQTKYIITGWYQFFNASAPTLRY